MIRIFEERESLLNESIGANANRRGRAGTNSVGSSATKNRFVTSHRSRWSPSELGRSLGRKEGSAINETIRRAQLGDASAFETLYQLHSRRVYSLCLRMLGNPVDAEDLTQDAFLQLFRKIHTFRGESAFSSWLYRLTANLVLMRFRRKKPATTSLDETPYRDGETLGPAQEVGAPDLQLAGLFDRVNLRSAIEQLPEGYRSMFLLHDVHGYEHHEIAKMLRCSVGNSKSQLHKARKRLRRLLRGVEHHACVNPSTSAVTP